MRYLPLITLITKTMTCLAQEQSKVNVVTVNGVQDLAEPSSICEKFGMHPFLLRAQDRDIVLASMKAAGVTRAHVAGWNNEKINMVVGTASGNVTPRDHNNKTNSVLCISTGSAPTPAPGPSCPAPAVSTPAPAPVAPSCSAPSCGMPAPCGPAKPCPVESCCKPPFVEIKGVCPIACCKPKKCVTKVRTSPCDSPCIKNYPHKKVYIIDELSLFCGPFIRIVETKCRPFSREIIWTVSKVFPFGSSLLPLPTMIRNASLLHKVLCEARDKFGVCGCVCLFIDHFNNIYIAAGDDYYQIVMNKPCGPPFPWGFPRRPFPFPGLRPPMFPPMFPCGPCPPQNIPVNCSPCTAPIKCAPKKVSGCEKPCPPMFTFCKVSCEQMIQVRRRGLYAVVFSRNLEFY